MDELSLRETLKSERRAARARIQRLNWELNEIVGDSDGSPQYSLRRFIHYERERLTGLLGDAQGYLDDIDQAVGRLDDGTYNKCEKCNKTIPEQRLMVFPTARTCVGCDAVRR